MKLRRDYRKFIILSTPRSGSNFLSQLLHSHPNVFSLGEIFNPYTVWGNPAVSDWETSALTRAYRNMFPMHFLKNQVFKEYSSVIHAVGFRLFYDHIHNTRFFCVADYIRKNSDIRILHLTRTNTLRCVVSFIIAKQTGEWMLWEKRRNVRSQVYIDPDECMQRMTQIQQWQVQYTRFFPDNPMLVVRYEDLSSNTGIEIQKIQKFLGVPVRRLETKMVKQNQRPLKDIVGNYPDLKERLMDTQWRQFLDE